ncbi:hypothetical protein [Rhodoferax sp. GW822-FHT02A01]|uniref:hypothetical protein n=1 Tax=Rhodoferax sp. GW822-FHT02A01 TaxID=3141537 RepID=UPI00315CEC90
MKIGDLLIRHKEIFAILPFLSLPAVPMAGPADPVSSGAQQPAKADLRPVATANEPKTGIEWAKAADNAAKREDLDYAFEAWGQAIEAYKREGTISDKSYLYRNRGVRLSQLHRDVEAIAAFNEAIRLKPDYIEAYRMRSNSFLHLGLTDEANADNATVRRLQIKVDEKPSGEQSLGTQNCKAKLFAYTMAFSDAPNVAKQAIAQKAMVILKRTSDEDVCAKAKALDQLWSDEYGSTPANP